jgi:hypothetical protein
MSEAPEQIWVDNYSGKTGEGYWLNEPLAFRNGGTQYHRADLSAAREAAARREGWNAAIEAAAEALRQEFYLHSRSPSLPNTGEVVAAIILAMKETDQ